MNFLERFSSLPNRIRFVRELSGLDRNEFSSIAGVSSATLKSWELGVKNPRKKTIENLVVTLNKMNISCTVAWIFNGEGDIPSLAESGIGKQPINFQEISEDMLYTSERNEIEIFQKFNQNSIVISITEASCKPYYSVGDYVGGIKKTGADIDKLIGKKCIIKLPNGRILVRKLLKSKNNNYTLFPVSIDFKTDDFLEYNTQIEFAAEIIWHRKIN